MKKAKIFTCMFLIIGGIFLNASAAQAQNPSQSVASLVNEVESYVEVKTKELVSQGKRVDADKRKNLADDKISLAKKYAAQAAARNDLKDLDFYYLGQLYAIAEMDEKAIEMMKKYLALFPADVKGSAVQSARSYIVVLSARSKQATQAEQFYQAWIKSEPVDKSQQPMLEQVLAVALFKENQYEKSANYGQEAFNLLKTLEAKTFAEKRSKEQLYMNLIEVLALSYRKNDNKEAAINILAEARAQSFTIPSANLYRKVMDFVQSGGFSEKKLMQKVESYASAAPAPELKFIDWLGQEPTTLQNLRGKVVLLDFWATWCMPCISTFPRLKNWHKKYAGDDFVIVGVTKYYGGQSREKPMSPLQELDFLGEFKQKYKLPYSFAVVESNEDGAKYGINAYPTTILLDRNGVVRYIGIGAGLEESENLEDMIKELLKERATASKQ